VLHQFLTANTPAIVARTRAKVAARFAPRATDEEIDQGIPLFLEQLIDLLRHSDASIRAMVESAAQHGCDLLEQGFTVAQVVHDYMSVCQAITELAEETRAPITADEYHTLHRCLDEAIAQAVTEYTRRREQAVTDLETERLGTLAHEFRNALGAAMLSFQTLRAGSVGLGGSTASLLDRSLRRLSALVESSIAHVRLESGKRTPERLSVRELVEDIEVGASMEANAQGLTLSVRRVEPEVDLAVDRQLVVAAVGNLLQNAFKFTRPHGTVSLTTSWTDDRVVIEVEDECGGLPDGSAEALFRPFEQRGANRTGLGLGLHITRRSVEAEGGVLRVRDVPGIGCVFSIDLPRAPSGP
jgi:signal transduction histidine kinase